MQQQEKYNKDSVGESSNADSKTFNIQDQLCLQHPRNAARNLSDIYNIMQTDDQVKKTKPFHSLIISDPWWSPRANKMNQQF